MPPLQMRIIPHTLKSNAIHSCLPSALFHITPNHNHEHYIQQEFYFNLVVDGTFKTMCMHNTFGCATHRVAAPHHTYIYGDIHI